MSRTDKGCKPFGRDWYTRNQWRRRIRRQNALSIKKGEFIPVRETHDVYFT